MNDPPDHFRAALADHYLLERELGRGGMATVYLARDLRHDQLVALKVLHPELAHALGPERFLREIRTTARLQHAHILAVLDSGEATGQLWYTMPYVHGESLRDRLRREAQLPLEVAVELARQVALALDYAHREQVVHRDLKPENILLSDGQALVAEFGLAKALAAGSERQLTESGMAVGTPAYMSPAAITDKRRCRDRGRRRRHRAGRLGQSGGGGRPERLARRLQPPALDSVVLVLRPAPESWEVETLEGWYLAGHVLERDKQRELPQNAELQRLEGLEPSQGVRGVRRIDLDPSRFLREPRGRLLDRILGGVEAPEQIAHHRLILLNLAVELLERAGQRGAGAGLRGVLDKLERHDGAREVVVEVCSQVLDAHRAHSLWSRGAVWSSTPAAATDTS